MTIDTTVFLEKGNKVQIGWIYPGNDCLNIRFGEHLNVSVHAIGLEDMLDLLKGIEVAEGFSILGEGPSPFKLVTRQDGIDLLEEMISDRDLLNRVRAEKDAEDVAEAV